MEDSGRNRRGEDRAAEVRVFDLNSPEKCSVSDIDVFLHSFLTCFCYLFGKFFDISGISGICCSCCRKIVEAQR